MFKWCFILYQLIFERHFEKFLKNMTLTPCYTSSSLLRFAYALLARCTQESFVLVHLIKTKPL
jgi:hypothetical protein